MPPLQQMMPRMHKVFILFLLIFAFSASASDLIVIPQIREYERFFRKILRCSWHISCYSTAPLGTSVTTINSGDLISSLPTSLNNNFTALNNGKVENATSSMSSVTTLSNLVSIGTITSGTWNASILTVAYGGTGSSTLASNHLLVGNGTGNIGVINGFGTSGQFLTSNGEATLPTWQSASFDKTNTQNPLTGAWNFTDTTRIKNLNASSTSANPIVLNGVSLNTPSSQGASSTSLINDGNGNLKWFGIPYFLAASTSIQVSGQNADNYEDLATTTASLISAGRVLVSVVAVGSHATAGQGCKTTIAVDNVNQDIALGQGMGAFVSAVGGDVGNLGFTFSTTTTSGFHAFTLRGFRTAGAGVCTYYINQISLMYLGQ